MEAYISLFIKAVFIENLALAFFLGNVYVPGGFQENFNSYGIGYCGHGCTDADRTGQ